MSSLFPEDHRRGERSRSRSRDRRSGDDVSSSAQAPAPERPSYSDTRESSYVFAEDDLDDRYKRRSDVPSGAALPYPEESDLYSAVPGQQQAHRYTYDSQQPVYKTASPTAESSSYRSRDDMPEVRYVEPRTDGKQSRKPAASGGDDAEKLKYLPQKYARKDDNDEKYAYKDDKYARPAETAAKYDKYARPAETRDKRDEDQESKPSKSKPQGYIRKYFGGSDDNSSDKDERDRKGKDKYDDDLAYGKPSVPVRPKQTNMDLAYGKSSAVPSASGPSSDAAPVTYGSYISGDKWEDSRGPSYVRDGGSEPRRPVEPVTQTYGSRTDVYPEDPRGSNPNVLTVEPGSRDRERSRDGRGEKDSLGVDSSRHRERSRDRRRDKADGPRSSGDLLTVDSGHSRHRSKSRERKRDKSPIPDTLIVETSRRDRDRSRDGRRDKSPQPPTSGMSSLTVNTGRMAGMTVAMAPNSPLQESYRGTYQSISPMPSPLLLASQNPTDDLRGLEPLSPLSDDGEGKKRGRRARFHDAEDITTQIANALKGTKTPDTGPLIHILPSLTHDQVIELRTEYKRMVKTGPEHKGVNVAKHIRVRLKDEDPLLMKACYAVALGKWESESYWANFWYQGDKTRRELLIEALMGRTNYEIAHIKDAFTDKKYDNSLTKCMKTELKEDKFKKAVLMVLDERRMEDYDHYGRRVPLDYDLVYQDTDDLYRAIKSEKSGETLMISIIVQRSDGHLRAILKEYEHQHRSNFARDALKKSGNLVGELLAHILNGVINRPVRDALLLHHAVTASRRDGLRRELLISRLVRYHWDAHHMQAVKKAYRERYGKDLQEAVREATSGEWGLFCRELCIARMPNDVRQVERVADIH